MRAPTHNGEYVSVLVGNCPDRTRPEMRLLVKGKPKPGLGCAATVSQATKWREAYLHMALASSVEYPNGRMMWA